MALIATFVVVTSSTVLAAGGIGISSMVQTHSSFHMRCNVLGVGVSAVDMNDVVHFCDAHIQRGHKGYVCVTGVHGVIEAQTDQELRMILNNSLLTTPDGMPTVWVGRFRGMMACQEYTGPTLC